MGKRVAESPQPGELTKRTCTTNTFDYETLPFVQTAVESSQLVEYPCFTALPKDDETPLEFRIDKTDAYIDLGKAFLSLKVQLLMEDGSIPPAGTNVAPINNVAYSMFDSVEVLVNDQKLTTTDNCYPWVSYIYTLMYNSDLVKQTILKGSGLYADTAGLFDRLGGEDENQGFKTRREVFADGKKVSLYSKVFLTTNFNRLLPSQTEVTLKFNRKPTSFFLMADQGNYKFRVLDAKLYALRANLSTEIQEMHQDIAADHGLLYPSTNIMTRMKTISLGDENLEWVPFNGKLPQRIYIWQVDQSAYNGSYTKNPFNFKLNQISKIQVFKNGRSLPTQQGIVDMQGDGYLKAYLTSMAAVNSPDTIPVNQYQYKFGYFVAALDLTNDQSSGCPYDNPTQSGTLRIAIDYAVPLEEPITVFCMGEFDGTFKIDDSRNIGWVE